MIAWFTAHKVTSFLIALLIGFIGWAVFFAGTDDPLAGVETTPVERAVVTQVISETGVVEAADDAELSFSASGRVASILATEGGPVADGAVIARLDTGSLTAGVQQAQAGLAREQARLAELRAGTRGEQLELNSANVAAAQTRLSTAEDNLEQTKKTQAELVRSAREDLYTSNLVPYLERGDSEDSRYNFSPPTVTGTYTGTESGQYNIEFYNFGAASGWSFELSGLESGRARVSTTQPQPLGARGLFIEFPQNFVRGNDVEWILEIPNTRSPQYTQLKNALQTAKDNQSSAITQAENSVADAEATLAQAKAQAGLSGAGSRSEQIASQEAAVAAARARVSQAQSARENAILRAPFSGVVTDININEGETAGLSQPVVTLISDDPFQISVGIPEVDTAQIDVGDPAEITLDAFEDEVFSGEVTAIAPTAKSVAGVQTVEVTVSLTETDQNIKTGLSADVDIVAAETEEVLTVSSRAIQGTVGDYFVYQISGEGEEAELEKTSVTLGLRGSDGNTEITSGLSAGTAIVSFIDPSARDRLEANNKL